MENKNKPVKVFRAGGVQASVFENEQKDNGGRTFRSSRVVLGRSYQDREGNWKKTNSFGITDLPKAILVLEEAHRFLALKSDAERKSTTGLLQDDLVGEELIEA